MDKKTLNCIDIAIGGRYFKKHTKELTQKDIDLYKRAISKTIARFSEMNKRFFYSSTFDRDDLYSIALVHLTSYLSLMALEVKPSAMAKFKEDFRAKYGDTAVLSQKHIDDKNIANFVYFLKQRFTDLSYKLQHRIASSLGGERVRMHLVSDHLISNDDVDRFVSRESDSLKEVSDEESLILRKKGKKTKLNNYQLEDGRYLRVYHKIVYGSREDQLLATHAMSDYRPDNIIECLEEEGMDIEFKQKLSKMDKSRRKNLLLKFISNNEKDPSMKESVVVAKKMVRGKL